jgi:hypothetical protein
MSALFLFCCLLFGAGDQKPCPNCVKPAAAVAPKCACGEKCPCAKHKHRHHRHHKHR